MASPIVTAVILSNPANAADLALELEAVGTRRASNARRILCQFGADAIPYLLRAAATGSADASPSAAPSVIAKLVDPKVKDEAPLDKAKQSAWEELESVLDRRERLKYDASVDAAAEEQAPPPQVEVIGIAPSPNHFWIGGHWGYYGGRYMWQGGRWEVRRPGYQWGQPTWVRHGGGWHYQRGGWRR